MKVYVAGPYTSDPETNTKRAIDVGAQIIKLGHSPFIPHLTHYVGLRHPYLTYEDYMRWDLAFLGDCDVLLRIPGESPGADREVQRAQELGVPVVYSLGEMLKVAP